MLNRRDLAKQFELVVQQEIRNYQNSLNTVLQSMRDLKEEIATVKRDCCECKAALHSDISKAQMQITQLEMFQRKHYQDLNSHINTQADENNKSYEATLSNKKDIQDLKVDNIKNFGLFVALTERIDGLNVNVKNIFDTITHSIENIERKIYKESDRTKAEILSFPSDAQEIKKELENKINIHNVDAAGIIREIRLLSRSVMVAEKKIENIYTLIERTKKAEVIP